VTHGSDVDLERLADYLGGALDGTPDAADVRRLVETDPRWAAAHAALVTADATVRAELTALGAEPVGVPADVAARLDAALASAPAPTRHTNVVRLDHERRRRRRQWAVALSTAAAVVVCGFSGVLALQSVQHNDSGGGATAARDTEARGAPSPATADNVGGGAGVQGAPVIASGNDYRPETLGQVARVPAAPAAPNDNTSDKRSSLSSSDRVAGPAELGRLADPTARATCLNAIVREYGGRVALVDYARFEGTPALVVVLDGAPAATGRRWVVVVGPTCGVGNAINDERYHAAL
jgi:hypothetical protein